MKPVNPRCTTAVIRTTVRIKKKEKFFSKLAFFILTTFEVHESLKKLIDFISCTIRLALL